MQKVLVVDDEQVIADTLCMIFAEEGFEAHAVYSTAEALTRARELRPDFIVSDVILPGINGIEAAVEICRFLPDCKILLISGQAATSDMLEKAHSEGHEFEILAKPVEPEFLIERLRCGAKVSGASQI
jgi:CheY-like chemotaxis protein